MKGKLSISNPRGERGSWVSIEVEDAKSGVPFIRIDIDYETFAKALFRHYQDCEFELRHLDLIGKRREFKEEHVLVPSYDFADQERVTAEAVAKFETDGWEGRVDDAINIHRYVRRTDEGSIYRVLYTRFVDDDPKVQTSP